MTTHRIRVTVNGIVARRRSSRGSSSCISCVMSYA